METVFIGQDEVPDLKGNNKVRKQSMWSLATTLLVLTLHRRGMQPRGPWRGCSVSSWPSR